MPIYLMSARQDSERFAAIDQRIRQTVPDVVRIGDLSELALRLKAAGPAYVLLDVSTKTDKNVDDLLNVVTRHRDGIFFVVISDDISATNYKRLVRSGGADWVSTAGAPQEIRDIVDGRRGRAAREEHGQTAEPVIIAFVPAAGGVGNSKIATEVGVWLKTAKGGENRRVCLIDLDFQTSHVCTYLDVEPKLRIEEVVKNPERLDEHLFDILGARHASGLDVFAAARGKFDLEDVSVAALDALFSMAAKRYDVILIDLPSVWFRWTFDIVANADGLVVTGLNTIPCLHQVTETLTAIRSSRADAAPIGVVINKCERNFLGRTVRRQHVDQMLGQEKVFFVRADTELMIDSINTGAPLVNTYRSSGIARDIGAVAGYCGGLKALTRPELPLPAVRAGATLSRINGVHQDLAMNARGAL